MIILELEIRDFKQYRGAHLFTPPENGVIGIVGPNGAGKTSLFEAIEWCLYQKNLKADEIPPRSVPNAKPLVRIQLASTRTAERFEITRSLTGSGSAKAEVRRLDGDTWTTVVTGTSAVQKYVAQSLIGLEYKAFVATFFTRQKELSFFGSLTGTDRRREVNRLLGLETIRKAQEQIAEDRRAQKSMAEGLLAAFTRQAGDRDFDAERTAAEAERTQLTERTDELSVAVSAAAAASRAVTALRDELEAKRASALALETQVATQQGLFARAQTTAQTADAELQAIAALEADVTSLGPMAERLPADTGRVAALETDRDAFARRQALVQDRLNALAEADRLEARSRTALQDAGETIGEGDIQERLRAFVGNASAIDTTAAERAVRSFEQAREIAEEQSGATEKLGRFQKRIDELLDLRAEKTGRIASFPSATELETRRTELEKQRALSQGTIDDLRKSITLHESFVDLEVSVVDRRCPTCGRPISEHELDDARRHVSGLVADLNARITEHQTVIARSADDLKQLDGTRAELAALEADLARDDQSLVTGREYFANQEGVIADLATRLATLLGQLQRREVPTAEELTTAQRQLETLRVRQRSHLQIAELLTSLERACEARDRADVALDAMPEVVFDPAALVAARQDQAESQQARTRLEATAKQIARRTEWETARESAGKQRIGAEEALASLEAQIKEIGFDSAAHEAARWQWDEAQQAERRAIQQRDASRLEVQRVGDRIDQIKRDQDKLGETKIDADRARVRADDLDRMYTAFNLFEQYVARKVRPQLEEITSELVRAITEGKYDGVRLDDDYGITVEDGEHGYFAIGSFSGGERDVISLAARLALSRLIGSQAANPPSFLVLDEVFGSLDRERRLGVLELLNTLSGSAEAFQQLFVISHVDDVRLSPAFTDIWRVVEEESGYSRLENMSQTGGFEDL